MLDASPAEFGHPQRPELWHDLRLELIVWRDRIERLVHVSEIGQFLRLSDFAILYAIIRNLDKFISKNQGFYRQIMSVESYTEAGRLFEELFLHYKKDYIEEKEILDFLKSRGLVVKDREQLVLLMVKAEKAIKWITVGVGSGWNPVIFANTPEDLEDFLKEHGMKKGKKKH